MNISESFHLPQDNRTALMENSKNEKNVLKNAMSLSSSNILKNSLAASRWEWDSVERRWMHAFACDRLCVCACV